MGEKELIEDSATDSLSDVWDDNSAFWNDEVDHAVPQFDRWNDELKELLSDEETPPENKTVTPEPVVELKAVEPKPKVPVSEDPVEVPVSENPVEVPVSEDPVEVPVSEKKTIEPPKRKGPAVTDKQLFLLIKKYKQASIICDVAGMTLQTLRNRVGHLCYKLKRYIDVEGLYRDTDPVECKSDGIRVSTGHLVETDFKLGDRFRVGFKDKYIILARLPKSSNT